jgi:hypothetical protein
MNHGSLLDLFSFTKLFARVRVSAQVHKKTPFSTVPIDRLTAQISSEVVRLCSRIHISMYMLITLQGETSLEKKNCFKYIE